jgi:catechol 2,3-dioxygenase-like lactoylglutathione lyase family enzyme
MIFLGLMLNEGNMAVNENMNAAASAPEIDGLHHVALEVTDMDVAISFYCGVVGLREVETPENVLKQGIHWLGLPEGKMLHLISVSKTVPHDRGHLALSVRNAHAWREYLIANGVELVEPKVKLYSAERVFVRDPAGNLVEFVRWE